MIQEELQRYIYKIHSAKLRKAKWNLTLPMAEARKNDEVISLAGSQMLRWIEELNGEMDCNARAKEIRREIRRLRSQDNSPTTKRQMRRLYAKLDELQFRKDYISVIIDRKSDYKRLCKGFKVNGITYKRLLGTSGGIKMSTIVFVSDRLHDELIRRIDNGRNMSKAFNPAKLEAYRALTCSASHPVSMPDGIAVVSDCYNSFLDEVIHLQNSEEEKGEPIMSDPVADIVEIDASDGFGIMLPSLAEKWSDEMRLDYMLSGCCCRYAFTKGMVFTFDFLDFADKVAGTYIIKDVWGNDVDLRDVELVLTESMVKLWDSYKDCDEFIRNSESNHYSFGLTKVTPKRLESERSLNYQFIQSYKLDEDDIQELISLSMEEISGVLGNDWRKTLLFLKGSDMNEHNVMAKNTEHYIRALMICPDIIHDSFVQDTVYKLIRNRIKRAKTGVVSVHGNFSVASGDPYALCQNMFGMAVTGLLKAGEIYNQYWSDLDTEDVVCFRAPMSCHNNIRKLHPANREDVNYWYRHMGICTIFNAWDTCMPALNGMDKQHCPYCR